MIKALEPFPSAGCPLLLTRIPAGFPSPADDYKDGDLNLHDRLVKHPAATFFAYAQGDSMQDAGIYDGDLLVVDRSLEPRTGDVVVAVIDGALTVKRFKRLGNRPYLAPENASHAPIRIEDGSSFEIWGVVTHSIRSHVRAR